MSLFEPIAIIGRACLFPGVLNPKELWDCALNKKNCLTPASDSDWRISLKTLKNTITDQGGYIRGFEQIFSAYEFFIPADIILQLDTVYQWLFHIGREALHDAGLSLKESSKIIAGAIIGNLSYPTNGLAKYSEAHWCQTKKPHPANRFMSGLPAMWLSRALGLTGKSFAIDAACASSVYAIKLACDQLHDKKADLMLAGAVNASDSLLLNRGFTALQAISKSGRSRPLHDEADGLLPSQGAGIVVLKRLNDAVKDKNKIYGVIRGIGLSNDGRGSGFLMPSEQGQVRAMQQAYFSSGVQPQDISWLECHATGTGVGDATEIRSMKKIFSHALNIGALKANLGHSITAAGMASLINVLNAFAAETQPPTRVAPENPCAALRSSAYQILNEAVFWEPRNGKRLAGINCFGFGGNNAHLIVEEAKTYRTPNFSAAKEHSAKEKIAIVGIGVMAGKTKNRAEFSRALFQNESSISEYSPGFRGGAMDYVELSIKETKFPPVDLQDTLGQQLAILKCAQDVFAEIKNIKPERSSVLVGMQCDAEITHYGLLSRFPQIKPAQIPLKPLNAAYALGAMPNIVTNRINCQFDLQGPSYSVSAEELSGFAALEIGIRDLRQHTVDAVLVGAVDMCCEPVHQSAAKELLDPELHIPADAAVIIALKRLTDAQADGDVIYAVVSEEKSDSSADINMHNSLVTKLWGHSHAASGLLHIAEAALTGQTANVTVKAINNETRSFFVCAEETVIPVVPAEKIKRGWQGVIPTSRAQLASTKVGHTLTGPQSKYFSAGTHEVIPKKTKKCLGDIAFVFTGATTSYTNMGQSLMMRFPQLVDAVAAQVPSIQATLDLIKAAQWTLLEELQVFSLLSQVHARFTQDILKIKPHACIGYCSGETNALYGMQAWRDLEGLYRDVDDSALYTDVLAGQFSILPEEWHKHSPKWQSWRVFADVEKVKKAVSEETKVRLTIINTAKDCVISGNPESCKQVLKKLNQPQANCLNYSMVLHCPEFHPYSQTWRKIHFRKTFAVPEVKFYSTGTGQHYFVDQNKSADALLAQASDTVNFPRVIQNAWNEGIRIFIEHGPRNLCSRFIKEILGEKEHLVVSLDQVKIDSVTQVTYAAQQLLAAGVELDYSEIL